MKIMTLLTDNGSQFTDRFTSDTKSSSGQHLLDLACLSMGIEHRLCPPRHTQTNGMVERFNGRISDIVKQTGSVRSSVCGRCETFPRRRTALATYRPTRWKSRSSPYAAAFVNLSS